MLLNALFVFSQQTLSPKRISISNPSQNVITKIKKAGIDLTCGPRFIDNNLEYYKAKFSAIGVNKIEKKDHLVDSMGGKVTLSFPKKSEIFVIEVL